MQNSAVPADEGLHYGFGWWHEQHNGGATTVPFSQPEWGVVTYAVQLSATKQSYRGQNHAISFLAQRDS